MPERTIPSNVPVPPILASQRKCIRSAPCPRLFAGLDFSLLQPRLCTTRPAFGSAEPDRPQILVGVVARTDLPPVDVGAQRR